jgi:hypothetical protein
MSGREGNYAAAKVLELPVVASVAVVLMDQ